MRIIFETPDKQFRIVERPDDVFSIEDLKGDTFNREAHPDIPEERMAREEREFDVLVEQEGVFGYELERWNPEAGTGYEHVDSCWGFVGSYAPNDRSGTFNHYIVDEMRETIAKMQLAAQVGLKVSLS